MQGHAFLTQNHVQVIRKKIPEDFQVFGDWRLKFDGSAERAF